MNPLSVSLSFSLSISFLSLVLLFFTDFQPIIACHLLEQNQVCSNLSPLKSLCDCQKEKADVRSSEILILKVDLPLYQTLNYENIVFLELDN